MVDTARGSARAGDRAVPEGCLPVAQQTFSTSAEGGSQTLVLGPTWLPTLRGRIEHGLQPNT